MSSFKLTRNVQATLQDPLSVDFQQLDNFIQQCFFGQLPKAATPNKKELITELNLSELVSRINIIAIELFNASRIPHFDPLILVSSKITGSKRICHLQFQPIEHIPLDCYSVLIQAAFHTVKFAIKNTYQNVAEIQEQLVKAVLISSKSVIALKSIIPILKVAKQKQIPFQHLGAGLYQLGWGCHSRLLNSSGGQNDSAIGSRLTQNKFTTASILNRAGLPGPEHYAVSDIASAQKSAAMLSGAVVVKPLDADRGEGVTINVTNDSQLKEAFSNAQKHTELQDVLVEKQVAGLCYRLVIQKNKLLYCVKRTPTSVTGNGRDSIKDLVNDYNLKQSLLPLWKREKEIPFDDETLDTLAAKSFSPDSVPDTGKEIPVRYLESTEWGGGSVDVTADVHPDNLAIAVQAADLFKLEVSGVDIITEDISIPWHQSEAIINEVNFLPSLGQSDASLEYIPQYLANIIEDKGRIPVELINADASRIELAKDRQRYYQMQGIDCFITTHQATFDSQGNELKLSSKTIRERCNALKLNKNVEALVILGSGIDQKTDLPFDQITALRTE